ncbi:MAG: ferrous iron transport protein B [Bacteroides sp.]|jgi:ferrous iron transport protein B|nr:ferrous iron transport protein B [Bacteroides sp.]
MTLNDLKNGERGIILKVKGRGAFRKRIIEMGFVVGKTVEVIKKAPLRDPIEYCVMGYNVSLRGSEAQLIEVAREKDYQPAGEKAFDGTITRDRINNLRRYGKTINVALVGNPNSGKTTFFNFASGSRERVGNYSGVTVDAKESRFRMNGYHFRITDLPGTYSISAYTPEEVFVRNFIQEKLPDVVINIVDASSIERNLYLTTQLIDMDIRVIMVLNMYDELEAKGDQLDYECLGKMIGIPIVPTVSSKGKGIRETFEKVIEVFEDRNPVIRHIHINYGNSMERSIKDLQDLINAPGNQYLTDRISSRFLAIKLLEKDKEAIKKIMGNCHNHEEILFYAGQERDRLEKEYGEHPETVITDLKYGFISGALKETLKQAAAEERKTSEVIDTLITHKVFGIPIFMLFMWIMFWATFQLGSYPMEWIESGVTAIAELLNGKMSDGPLKDLLVNGIVSGVGGVIVFLPNIILLFFFISLMEDTGYMSRAVFIMDKLMHKIGLHGKSFIPLLMGFGCNVPAILATRTLSNRNDRLLTMLINPFMSCSARLPIYVLLISAFFPENQGSMLFMIYLIGVLVAIGVALLFKKLLFRSQEVPFVMELPPYRMPTLRATTTHMWSRAAQYLRKIGGVILVASIIIWALGYFPHGNKYQQEITVQQETLRKEYQAKAISNPALTPEEKEVLTQGLDEQLQLTAARGYTSRLENSYIGTIGKTIQPVMNPLGFDWKMTISIISGVAAKEIVVSTLGVLYQADENVQTQSQSLIEKLQTQTYTQGPNAGQYVFNKRVAFSFMLFVLLYFPCIGVIVAISKESGHWKWGLFTIVYTTLIAWVFSFVFYQASGLFV